MKKPPSDFWTDYYEDLKRIAGRIFRGRDDWTLQTTALLHEAFIKRSKSQRQFRFENKEHFLAEMSLVLGSELVDEHRRRAAQRRDAAAKVPLSEWEGFEGPPDMIAGLDAARALQLLREDPPADLELVVQHHIGGLTTNELAELYETTTGAISQRLFRARKRARRIVEEDPSAPR